MPNAIRLPSDAEVRHMLAALLDQEVEVEHAAHEPAESDCIARYVDDEGSLAAIGICDLALASAMAAALSLIPVDTAQDARKLGTLPESFVASFREVMNVISSILCDDATPHVRLAEIHASRGSLPPEVVQLAAQPQARRAFRVSIGDYGTGTLAFLTR